MFEFMELRSKHLMTWLTPKIFYELKILIPVDVFSNNSNFYHSNCNFLKIYNFQDFYFNSFSNSNKNYFIYD